MLVLPRPLPKELFKGEHFVLADLLKLLPGSSLQLESTPEPLGRPDHLPLAAHDPKPAPQGAKKKKREKKKTEQVKVAGVVLKGFVDWMDLAISESE